MSDNLNLIDFEKFKDAVSVSDDHCLNYVRQQSVSSEDIILTINITYDCLRRWHEAKRAEPLKQINCSYVDLLNTVLAAKYSLKIKEDSCRLEGRLRRVCGEIKNKFKCTSGASYRNLIESELKLAVRADEVVTVSELETMLRNEKKRADVLLNENEILIARCDELHNQMIEFEAKEEVASEALGEANAKIDSLVTENQKLHHYIDKLGQDTAFENNGKVITQMGERQQRRKLKELRTNVQRTLWFAKTFGLTLNSVSFSGQDGLNHTLSYEENETKSFKDLSEEEKDKLKSVLFVLDKFCIGDAAYHELTMCSGGEDLPRSFLIKQCKDDLNKLCHITRTPGVAPGAQLDFAAELESVLKKQVTTKCVIPKNIHTPHPSGIPN